MIVKMVVLPLNGHLYCTDDDFNGNLYDHDERAGFAFYLYVTHF